MSSFSWPPEGSGSGSGVSSLNTLTGALTLAAGANITITPSGGNTLTIASSGGGGTPGGSDGEVQFNNAGSFGGLPLSKVDFSEGFLGLQQSSPQAPLHVTGASGAVLAAPASASVSSTQDIAVDSPVSYAVSQVNGPTSPSFLTNTLNYIDQAQGGNPNQNTGETGYIATGQTITYQLYVYRNVAGIRVINPNPSTFGFTDLLNDGSPFGVDINGIGNNALHVDGCDGYILYKSDDQGYGPYWIDLPGAGTTTYSDLGYTTQDAYEDGPYVANGSNWSPGLAQYKVYGSDTYRSDYITDPQTDDSSGSTLFMGTTFAAPTEDGYEINTVEGGFFDLGPTAIFYNDYGQSGGTDLQAFNSSAFPAFNTSLSDGSEQSATQNDAETGYTADGSFTNHFYFVAEYKVNPVNGVRYFTNGYNFGFADNGDNSTYAVDIILNPGDGDGRVLLYSLDGGSSYTQGLDLGAGTTYTDDNSAGSAPAVTPLISGYAGITRNFLAYGEITSPSAKYSSTHNDQTFMDNNSAPYFIEHVISGIGNADLIKIIENSYRNGSVTPSQAGGTLFQTAGGFSGDTTVTPNTIGYLATGQTFAYQVHSTKVVSGVTIYSAGHADASITLPNDGNFYYLTLTNASVAGATYKAQRIINAGSPQYQTYASSPLQDDTTVSWGSSSTLTPTSGAITGAIIERSMDGTFTDPAIATFRNTNAATSYKSFAEFDYNTGSGYASAGKYGVEGNGNFFLDSQSHGLEIGSIGSPHTRFQVSQTVFNLNSTASEWFIRGVSVNYLLYVQSQSSNDKVILGDSASSTNSMLNVKPNNGARAGISILNFTTANSATAMDYRDSSANVWWGFTQAGRMWVGVQGGNPNTAVLTVGPGSSGVGQLQLQNTTPLPGTPIAGSIERNDATGGGLLYTDSSLNRKSVIFGLGSGTATEVWYSDANGNPVATADLRVQAGVLVIAAVQLEAKGGVSLDSNQSLAMGTNSKITGNFGTGEANFTTSQTLGANHIYNWTSGTVNATLPTAVGIQGREYIINNAGTGVVTLLTTSAQTIAGKASAAITLAQNQFITVFSDNANWQIHSTNISSLLIGNFTSVNTQHIQGTGTAPTIAAGVGAGSSPTVSITGSDTAGAVSVTTGTLPTGTNAVVATITFNTAYGTAPYIVLQPANAITATLSGVSMVFVTSTTTTFVITSGTTALTAATTYKWNYVSVG